MLLLSERDRDPEQTCTCKLESLRPADDHRRCEENPLKFLVKRPRSELPAVEFRGGRFLAKVRAQDRQRERRGARTAIAEIELVCVMCDRAQLVGGVVGVVQYE